MCCRGVERWVRTCRPELLDRTLVWNESHLRRCLHEFEVHYNQHQAMCQAAPVRAVPAPITDPGRLARLDVRRNDRLGGVIHNTNMPPELHGRDFRQAHDRVSIIQP